jgi:hypothetical protein
MARALLALMRPALAVQAAVAVLVFTGGAAAQTQGDEGADSDDARFAWIDGALERAERPSRTWFTLWTVTYAGLAAGQGGFALAVHDTTWRADAVIGAIKSTLGFAAILVIPHTVLHARSELRAADASTPMARHLRRLRAEELLSASAAEDAFGTSWVPHVAAALTNLAGVYILFHDYRADALAWISLLTGTAVAELQIATRPTLALRAWRDYPSHTRVEPERPSSVSWSLRLFPGGLAVEASF